MKDLTYHDSDHSRRIPLANPWCSCWILNFSPFSSSLLSSPSCNRRVKLYNLIKAVFAQNKSLKWNKKLIGENPIFPFLKSRFWPSSIQQPNFRLAYLLIQYREMWKLSSIRKTSARAFQLYEEIPLTEPDVGTMVVLKWPKLTSLT